MYWKSLNNGASAFYLEKMPWPQDSFKLLCFNSRIDVMSGGVGSSLKALKKLTTPTRDVFSVASWLQHDFSPRLFLFSDVSSFFTVASEPRRYLQYFNRNQVLRIRCPLTISSNAVGFINWSYRPRLGAKSFVKSFDASSSRQVPSKCFTFPFCTSPSHQEYATASSKLL